jgi:hypothetical protein
MTERPGLIHRSPRKSCRLKLAASQLVEPSADALASTVVCVVQIVDQDSGPGAVLAGAQLLYRGQHCRPWEGRVSSRRRSYASSSPITTSALARCSRVTMRIDRTEHLKDDAGGRALSVSDARSADHSHDSSQTPICDRKGCSAEESGQYG